MNYEIYQSTSTGALYIMRDFDVEETELESGSIVHVGGPYASYEAADIARISLELDAATTASGVPAISPSPPPAELPPGESTPLLPPSSPPLPGGSSSTIIPAPTPAYQPPIVSAIPYAMPEEPKPAKKKRVWPWVVVGIATVGATVLTAAGIGYAVLRKPKKKKRRRRR